MAGLYRLQCPIYSCTAGIGELVDQRSAAPIQRPSAWSAVAEPAAVQLPSLSDCEQLQVDVATFVILLTTAVTVQV